MATEPAERQVEEIESLCMNCEENGTTRLLLTRIPFFREIVIMSFACPECGFKNAEIQSAGEIQQRGVRYTFKVDSKQDLQRQIVKSDSAVVRIEEIDLEIPPGRGQLSNLEGILSMVQSDLENQQPQRKEVDEALYEKIQVVIHSIEAMAAGKNLPFTIILDDPAGNSSLEPATSDAHGKYVRSEYARTAQQNAALGLNAGENATEAPPSIVRPEYHANQMQPALPGTGENVANVDSIADDDIIENQVYSFPASCPGCVKPCTTNMKMVRIPYFKEVVLMSTVCEHCGYRSNEVKTGGEVPELGRRITLKVDSKLDLSRDILKAENCALSCPELSLNVEPGTMGGRFTTVEGLLTQVRNDLRSSIFGDEENGNGVVGDSMVKTEQAKWGEFFEQLNKAITGDMKFTIILSDPLAGSYVQSLTAPDPDPQIIVEEYTRTEQEEEDLGLADMQTEGYTGEPVDSESRDKTGGEHDENAATLDAVHLNVQERLRELATEDDEGS